MIRSHDAKQLTTAELERAKRELRANPALMKTGHEMHGCRSVPICVCGAARVHLRVIPGG